MIQILLFHKATLSLLLTFAPPLSSHQELFALPASAL